MHSTSIFGAAATTEAQERGGRGGGELNKLILNPV